MSSLLAWIVFKPDIIVEDEPGHEDKNIGKLAAAFYFFFGQAFAFTYVSGSWLIVCKLYEPLHHKIYAVAVIIPGRVPGDHKYVGLLVSQTFLVLTSSLQHALRACR